MKHVLYPGQKFRLVPFSEYKQDKPRLVNVVHESFHDQDRNLQRHPTQLRTGSSYEDVIIQGDGPKKGERVSFRFQGDLAAIAWTVVSTALQGGGTGHGPGDVYPDGHHVVARGDGDLRLRFYQTGCFNGMVPPEGVELLNGDEFPDQPTEWESRQVRRQVKRDR